MSDRKMWRGRGNAGVGTGQPVETNTRPWSHYGVEDNRLNTLARTPNDQGIKRWRE